MPSLVQSVPALLVMSESLSRLILNTPVQNPINPVSGDHLLYIRLGLRPKPWTLNSKPQPIQFQGLGFSEPRPRDLARGRARR